MKRFEIMLNDWNKRYLAAAKNADEARCAAIEEYTNESCDRKASDIYAWSIRQLLEPDGA